jgi:hypothetical protein
LAPGGWNAALNHAAWTLGRWVAAGLLEQADVEDGLYAAAMRNGLVADDGQRQCWATICSGPDDPWFLTSVSRDRLPTV